MGSPRKRKYAANAAQAAKVAAGERAARLSAQVATEKTIDLACNNCWESIYRAKVMRLRQSIAGKPLEPGDLEKIAEFKSPVQCIQVDCPFCGGDVFEHNYGGGYRVYPAELHTEVTKLKRWPHDHGVRPGIRIAQPYASPG
jgi:hypothetical protein